MRHRYFEFNGKKFPFQDDLGLADAFLDLVMAYGDEAMDALRQMELDPEQSEMLQELLDQGLLDKVQGRWRLTPRAINAMQRKALMEVFAHLPRGTREGHASIEVGTGGERVEGTRPYQFGDPVSEIDLSATLRNTIQRMAGDEANVAADPRVGRIGDDGVADSTGADSDAGHLSPGLRPTRGSAATSSSPHGTAKFSFALPLKIADRDLERYNAEAQTSCSTVLLLDMSGSMARFGRFMQAKKCAMALHALIRQRFPQDTVDIVGFYSGAAEIPEGKLPLLRPKPVTMFDSSIRLRVPLKKLDDAPQHFTNLHLGLLKAKRLLARRGGDNRLMFIITDGQPTAHVQGDYVHLLYPPDRASHVATLKEALLIARRGVRICTFALTDDYWDMDWLGFVEQLGRLTRGVTFNCASGDLSSCVMESYLSGRRKKAYIS
jgi:Ca-activated chloride channel homolog